MMKPALCPKVYNNQHKYQSLSKKIWFFYMEYVCMKLRSKLLHYKIYNLSQDILVPEYRYPNLT